jgi:ectoine hydroxylase-related dioxygenase (phytanoyl-CoA dioxygenase family)
LRENLDKFTLGIDIESSDPSGGFASVWIGIENTSKESGLQVIPASHLFGKTIQQVAHERGLERRNLSPEVALELAREIHPAAELREPNVSDGEAIFLDGRLWHGSHNRRDSGTRTALLFQYAKATAPVRIPDYRVLTWPFKFLEEPKPPAILVHGKAPTGSNHLVPPPRTNECGLLLS